MIGFGLGFLLGVLACGIVVGALIFLNQRRF